MASSMMAERATKIIRPVLEFLFISNQFPTDLFSQMLNLSAAFEENLSELTSSNVWSYNTSTYNLLFNIKYGGGSDGCKVEVKYIVSEREGGGLYEQVLSFTFVQRREEVRAKRVPFFTEN